MACTEFATGQLFLAVPMCRFVYRNLEVEARGVPQLRRVEPIEPAWLEVDDCETEAESE